MSNLPTASRQGLGKDLSKWKVRSTPEQVVVYVANPQAPSVVIGPVPGDELQQGRRIAMGQELCAWLNGDTIYPEWLHQMKLVRRVACEMLTTTGVHIRVGEAYQWERPFPDAMMEVARNMMTFLLEKRRPILALQKGKILCQSPTA